MKRALIIRPRSQVVLVDPVSTFESWSGAGQCSVDDWPERWRSTCSRRFLWLVSKGSVNVKEAKILLSELYRTIFSDAATSMKSRLFETLQHMVARCLGAELRSEPLSV